MANKQQTTTNTDKKINNPNIPQKDMNARQGQRSQNQTSDEGENLRSFSGERADADTNRRASEGGRDISQEQGDRRSQNQTDRQDTTQRPPEKKDNKSDRH